MYKKENEYQTMATEPCKSNASGYIGISLQDINNSLEELEASIAYLRDIIDPIMDTSRLCNSVGDATCESKQPSQSPLANELRRILFRINSITVRVGDFSRSVDL